jgi:hypothetical protein
MSDARTFDTSADRTGPASDSRVADGRLVLTSALRVSESAGEEATADTAAPAQPDDAALRAIVREILREELAGPFGERMTRSVRRLVRAEVAILLASRDPD